MECHDRSDAHAKDVVRARLREDRVEVLHFPRDTVPNAVAPTQAAPSTVRQANRVGISERLGNLDVAVR